MAGHIVSANVWVDTRVLVSYRAVSSTPVMRRGCQLPQLMKQRVFQVQLELPRLEVKQSQDVCARWNVREMIRSTYSMSVHGAYESSQPAAVQSQLINRLSCRRKSSHKVNL